MWCKVCLRHVFEFESLLQDNVYFQYFGWIQFFIVDLPLFGSSFEVFWGGRRSDLGQCGLTVYPPKI